MGKIILIVIGVGVAVYLFNLLSGKSSDEATTKGCMASMGCGYGIVQIIITVGMIALAIAFVSWLFR